MSSTIDEIKARIDIVDLVGETVQLRRSGKSYTGFCPFHSNTRTPAFAVFPESGTWRCFGQCNEGGDIFKFVMKKEGWDFSEALRYLAERAGVELKPPTPAEKAVAEEHQALRALLEEAAVFYHHNLVNTTAGRSALEYLRQKRGLSLETIELFGLGYAPDAWDATSAHFRSRGVPVEQLFEAGLIVEREPAGGRSGFYDRFRNRIMFPIRDESGRMAGFGGRILNPQDMPKFINTPQTPVFEKGRLLYALDLAKRAIRAKDQAVIVEGYLDVIALHQAGFTNTVSPMGTALTEHQLRLIKRLSRRIVLALDPDTAGDQATLRGLQIARQTMDHTDEPVFDARGLLRHESRLQADIRVTALPPGMDPDEIVSGDPQAWEKILQNAQPVVIHVMETLAAGQDLNDPKVKANIASQVQPLIEEVPDPVERDAYRQRLARMLKIDERALIQSARGQKGASRRQRQTSSGKPAPVQVDLLTASKVSSFALEAHCLGVLLRRPDLLYRVDREMLRFGLQRLSKRDFQHADHQNLFQLIQESVDQDFNEPIDFVFNNFSLPMMELADGLLERTDELDPQQERVLGDLLRGLLELRRRSLQQEMEYTRFLMEEVHQEGDLRATQYMQSMVQLIEIKKLLDIAIGQHTSRTLPGQ